jgi:hypothetical protein
VRKAWITGTLAALALAVVVAPAGARQSFESKVSIHVLQKRAAGGTITAFGKVTSPKNACEPQRKVVLYGKPAGSERERLGSDRTNDAGEWQVSDVDSNGLRYIQAKVKPREISAGTCKRARSRRFHFA